MTEHLELDGFDRIRLPRQERSRRAFFAAMDAFDELLRDRPLAEVSMDQVAKRAGLAITSVYARFDGKAALVLALHERTIATALARLDSALADASLVDAPVNEIVRQLVEAAVSFADQNTHVFRAVLAAADEETNQRVAAFIRAGSERAASVLVPRLSGPAESVERDIDFAWRSLIAVLQQRWVLWGADPSRFAIDNDEVVDRLTRAFLAAIPLP